MLDCEICRRCCGGHKRLSTAKYSEVELSVVRCTKAYEPRQRVKPLCTNALVCCEPNFGSIIPIRVLQLCRAETNLSHSRDWKCRRFGGLNQFLVGSELPWRSQNNHQKRAAHFLAGKIGATYNYPSQKYMSPVDTWVKSDYIRESRRKKPWRAFGC